MRIFVTGGTGFIGSQVVKELQNGENTLLLLSRQPQSARHLPAMPNVDMVQGDLSDIDRWKGKVKHFRPEAALHLAWEDLPNYDAKTSIRNLNYGLNLITMLAESGCECVICSGSCWEYGQQAGKLSEDAVLKPSNAFAAAKNALHWLGREVAREHGMNFIWTRLFYVYGPGQRETSLIPYIIGCVKNGKKPELKTPSARNDFIYVEDVAMAISTIVTKPQKYSVYNIGSGVATSVQRIVEIVCDEFDIKYQPDPAKKPVNNTTIDFRADISKIITEIGWEPRIGIEEGIGRTIRELKRQKKGKNDE